MTIVGVLLAIVAAIVGLRVLVWYGERHHGSYESMLPAGIGLVVWLVLVAILLHLLTGR